MRVRVSVLLAGLLCCATLFGQAAPSGNQAQTFHIKGTVTDPLGAVIQGVKVAFQNEQLSKAVTTNNVGVFEADLSLGDYTMTAQSRGFRFYRRPLFRVASPVNVRFDIVLPVGKNINRIEVGEAGPPSYCGEEFFPAASKDGTPFKLYIRYGGLRSTNGETRDYRADKNKYDDPVFVAYNLFSYALQIACCPQNAPSPPMNTGISGCFAEGGMSENEASSTPTLAKNARMGHPLWKRST
jgi:hypothetical protein